MFLTRIARAAQNINISNETHDSYAFKHAHSFEMRLAESQRILEKYPDRIPVICERANLGQTTPEMDKKKFLVPSDLTVGQFIYVVRKRIRLNPEQAIYLFVNGMIPPTSALMCDCFQSNRDEDGFLYVKYCCENTFGGRVYPKN
jgi:GABA(A) receptor-associated protein